MRRLFDDGFADERKRLLREEYDPDATMRYGEGDVAMEDYLKRELMHYFQYSNTRNLPSAVDGFTTARRKYVAGLLLSAKYATRETRLSQLSSEIAAVMHYHHGDASFVNTGVSMGQTHTGTNNIALLHGIGQFGSIRTKPSEHSAPRYLNGMLAPVSDAMFPRADDAVLPRVYDEGVAVEPVRYLPVVPFVLVSGPISAIGTGFSCSCEPRDPFEVIAAVRALLDGRDFEEPRPWYAGFEGTAELAPGGDRVLIRGRCALEDGAVHVTALPIGTWIEDFIEDARKTFGAGLLRVEDASCDRSVDLRLHLDTESMPQSEAEAYKRLKLETTRSLRNMHLWDAEGRIRRFEDAGAILREHHAARLEGYRVRREHQLGRLRREEAEATDRARFIREWNAGELTVNGASEENTIDRQLRERGYRTAEQLDALLMGDRAEPTQQDQDQTQAQQQNQDEAQQASQQSSHRHLSGKGWRPDQLSAAGEARALRQAKAAAEELRRLEALSATDIWRSELSHLETTLLAYFDERAKRPPAVTSKLAETSGTKRKAHRAASSKPPKKRIAKN